MRSKGHLIKPPRISDWCPLFPAYPTMPDEQRNGWGTTFLVFTVGAALGGGLALLTASRSGPENRQKLHDMVDETRGKLNEMTE